MLSLSSGSYLFAQSVNHNSSRFNRGTLSGGGDSDGQLNPNRNLRGDPIPGIDVIVEKDCRCYFQTRWKPATRTATPLRIASRMK